MYVGNISKIIHKHFLGILILLEEKIVGDRAIDICRKLPYSNFECADPEGFKDWVWLLWNNVHVNMTILHKNFSEPSPWLLSSIYASLIFNIHIAFLDNICSLAGSHFLPWSSKVILMKLHLSLSWRCFDSSWPYQFFQGSLGYL